MVILRNLGLFFLCILADIVSIIWLLFAMFRSPDRFLKIAIGKDKTLNVAIGGSEDETLSSRAARSMLRGEKWGCFLCKFLDLVKKNHCIDSIKRSNK